MQNGGKCKQQSEDVEYIIDVGNGLGGITITYLLLNIQAYFPSFLSLLQSYFGSLLYIKITFQLN